VCLPHEIAHVGAERLSQVNEPREDLVDLLAVAPHLVAGASGAIGPPVGVGDRRLRHAVAVQAHDRAEGTPLEPANQQLAKGWVVGIAAVESADVRGPPRDSSDAHVEARGNLPAEVLPRRLDVPGPHQRPVSLTSRPCAANQIHGVALARFDLTFVEPAGVVLGVEVAHLKRRTCMVAVLGVVVVLVLRFGYIQPEGLDAQVEVVLLALVPHVGASGGIGRVVEHARVLESHVKVDAGLRPHQQVILAHFFVILRRDRALRPDGDHQLDAERAQLLHHRGGVGEEGFVESEIAHPGPVEAIGHDDVHGQAATLVLAGNLQQFLLVPIAQLALPKPEAVLRHHGGLAGGRRERAHDLSRVVPRGDPVVGLPSGCRLPLGPVHGEGGRPNAGVVPEEPVAGAGQDERNAGLRIAMRKLEDAPLQVHHMLLVLTHSVKLLAGIGLE